MREKDVSVDLKYQYDQYDIDGLSDRQKDEDKKCGIYWTKAVALDSTRSISIEKILPGSLTSILEDNKVKVGDRVLIPCNTGGHWVGLMAEIGANNTVNISYYDSLYSPAGESADLKRRVASVFQSKGYIANFVERNIDIARQNDAVSCGPYTVYNLTNAAYNITSRENPDIVTLRAEHSIIIGEQSDGPNNPKRNKTVSYTERLGIKYPESTHIRIIEAKRQELIERRNLAPGVMNHQEEQISVAIDESGNNALHLAARMGDVNKINQLLGMKISAKSANNDGNAPLHLAVASGNKEAIQRLMEENPQALLVKNKKGRTPLCEAITQIEFLEDQKKRVASSLEPSAQKEVMINLNRQISQNLENIKLIAERDPRALDIKDNQERTALDLARKINNQTLINALEHAAMPNRGISHSVFDTKGVIGNGSIHGPAGLPRANTTSRRTGYDGGH